jgi:hypothetical protein
MEDGMTDHKKDDPMMINGHRIGMDHYEQIEVAAYLAYELCSAMETWDTRGLTWNKMGKLPKKADGHYGTLKELIHKEFGTEVPTKRVKP